MGKPIDLTGQRFGRLVVEKMSDRKDTTRATYWECRCDCGGAKTVRSSSLRAGIANSCGCLLVEYRKNGSTKIDIIGKRFGRLIAVEETAERTSNGAVKYLCLCDCGKTKIIDGTSLRMGGTRSCGCLLAESSSKRARTHGQSKTRLYKIWAGMRDRCTNPKRREYKDYGGRGIAVCDEWMNDFPTFRDWSMANGYTDELTIDRVDNDGPYSPGNCKWVGRKSQADNTRLTIHITVDGVTKNIGDWAKTIGVGRSTISRRVKIGDAVEYISKRLK